MTALIVTVSLLAGASSVAAGPQGRGHEKQHKAAVKQAKKEAKDDRKDAGHMRFAGLDLNGDRVITRSEWRGTDASFRANDWNRDGVLSGDEVRPDATKPDHFYRKDWKGDLKEFDKADTNHDGVLTPEEFARWR